MAELPELTILQREMDAALSERTIARDGLEADFYRQGGHMDA